MRAGRLLAIDTPSRLKIDVLPGIAWDMFLRRTDHERHSDDMSSLIIAMEVLDSNPGVIRTGLISDHLRVITSMDMNGKKLIEALNATDVQVEMVEQVEPSLEDVFLSLAGRPGKNKDL
jgi:hypothetical protein